MNAPRLIGLVTAVAFLATLAGCGGGAFDDLVRGLASSTKYTKQELDEALRAANGGKALTEDVSRELDESAAASKLMDSANSAASFACDLLGSPWVSPTLPGPDEVLTSKLEGGVMVKEVKAEALSATAVNAMCKAKEGIDGLQD